MSNPRIILAGASALLLLAGCAETVESINFGDSYDAAKMAEPQGAAFDQKLHAGYLELATGEREEYDWGDSAHFAKKALAAAGGQGVAPDAVGDRDLPMESVPVLTAAHNQLSGALAGGAAAKAPDAAARAQVSFDCWLQEQEENIQPDDIAACRDSFKMAMAALGQSGSDYVVYFGLGSDKLSAAGEATVMAAAAAAKADSTARVMVGGHTDKAGGSAANIVLSERRAEAVRALLISAGVKADQIQRATYGESQPAVATGDGVAEGKNRRVEITLVQ